MPETTPTSGAPTSAAPHSVPAMFSVDTPVTNTAANVMGATSIENAGSTKSSLAIWIGFGLILIAMIIAGTYYYMSTVQPDVTYDVPVVNVPVETDEERAVSDLESIDATLDAALDSSNIDADLDAISADLNTIQ